VLLRAIAGGTERRRVQLTMMSSDSGAEVPASPPLDSLISWNNATDNSGVVYSYAAGAMQSRVEFFDFATRRTRTLAAISDSQVNRSVSTLPDGRLVIHQRRAREIVIATNAGVPIRTIKYPEGLAGVNRLVVFPGGAELLLQGYDTKTQDTTTLYRVRVADGTARYVAGIWSEGTMGLRVLDNGDILTAIAETGQLTALYVVRGGNGPMIRLGALPYGNGTGYSISSDGLRMVATVNEPHGDVWLARNLDKMLRR
jgi:hypothetical protein